MRWLRLLVAVTAATACQASSADGRTSSSAAPGSSVATTASPTSSIQAPAAEIAAEIERARLEVCALVDVAVVAEVFGETASLTTQPMSEANGPACGVPHPRQGGYLVVVQFQPADRWAELAASGRPLEGLRSPAVTTDSSTVFVRDDERHVVTMVSSGDPTAGAEAAVSRLAGRLYAPDPPPTTVPSGFASLPLGGPGCQPPSPLVGSEVRGSAGTDQLYGLVFVNSPITASRDIKIVWRMTGEGELQASATGPDGQPVPLVAGPTPHEGSTFQRPGDEWGVVYRFEQPGCWRLGLRRGDSHGDVWIEVAAP